MRTFVPFTFAFCFLWTGCTASPPTKAQIAATEVAVTQAERLAKTYLDRPVCPAPAPCSAPATRVRVIHDAHAAHVAFLVLQNASEANAQASMAMVEAAIAVLKSDLPTN